MARNDGNASRNRKLGIRKTEKEDSFEKFIDEFNKQKRREQRKKAMSSNSR